MTVNQKNSFNIHISNSEWNMLEFGIGDYDGDRTHFFVRIDNDDKLPLYTHVKEVLNGTANLNIWYQKMNNPYNKWDKSMEGLLSVYDSKLLVDYSISRLIEIANLIEQYFINK